MKSVNVHFVASFLLKHTNVQVTMTTTTLFDVYCHGAPRHLAVSRSFMNFLASVTPERPGLAAVEVSPIWLGVILFDVVSNVVYYKLMMMCTST